MRTCSRAPSGLPPPHAARPSRTSANRATVILRWSEDDAGNGAEHKRTASARLSGLEGIGDPREDVRRRDGAVPAAGNPERRAIGAGK